VGGGRRWLRISGVGVHRRSKQSSSTTSCTRLTLHPVVPAVVHHSGPGGVTGMVLLSESHLTVHTFPEYRTLCLNLFCCSPRPEWDFTLQLKHRFGASDVEIRVFERSTS